MLLDFVLASTIDAIWDFHIPTMAMRMDRDWEAVFGYEKGELPNNLSVWKDRLHKNDYADVVKAFRAITKETKTLELKMRVKNKNEKFVWIVSRMVVAETDGEGKARRIVGILKNIDAEVAMQRSLAELNQTLDAKVRERTAALVQTNAELERFAYSLSHDMKAPLTRVASWLAILQISLRGALIKQNEQALTYAKDDIAAMARMIEAMMALFQVAKREVHFTNLDLQAIALSQVDVLRQENLNVEINADIEHNLRGFGDTELLQIVFKNLLENAVKFSRGQNPIRIKIGRTVGHPNTFFVQDYGVGFDMQYADKIFAPFQRLHSEKDFTGTGIGLSIVERIVHRHQGRVEIKSQVGVGTTVIFSLFSNE
ncbi:MAG: PAS domain-containing protein [Spirochaetes bacterium]|nr:PAS domain-containing protein [Spirochaetota bacterium]